MRYPGLNTFEHSTFSLEGMVLGKHKTQLENPYDHRG
jgi:hypothetical protein